MGSLSVEKDFGIEGVEGPLDTEGVIPRKVLKGRRGLLPETSRLNEVFPSGPLACEFLGEYRLIEDLIRPGA